MFYAITEAFNTLRDFMSAGGSVLWLIAILAAFMWAIILERIWYFIFFCVKFTYSEKAISKVPSF